MRVTTVGGAWQSDPNVALWALMVLRQRDAGEVLGRAASWIKSQKDPRAALEVVWLHQAFGRPGSPWITQLTGSPDPRLRGAATRQLSH